MRYTDPLGLAVPAIIAGCAANPTCAAVVIGAIGAGAKAISETLSALGGSGGNVIPFPGTSWPTANEECPPDDDVDCDEWLGLLNDEYKQILTFKMSGGQTQLAERQHNQSVSLFCQVCPGQCQLAKRF